MLKTNKLFNKLIIGFIFCIVLFTGMALSSEKALAYDTSVVCTWENAGKIECKYNVTEADNSLTGSAIVGAVGMVTAGPVAAVAAVATKYAAVEAYNWFENSCKTGAGCDDYFFDPAASQAAGYPVFGGGNTNDNHSGYLHYITNNPLVAYQSDNSQGIKNIPAAEDANWTLVGKYQKALDAAESGKCSLLKTTNCNIQNAGRYDGEGLDAKPFLQTIESIQSVAAMKQLCEQQAPLGFVLCPIYEGIVGSISGLIGGQGVSGPREGLLISFLTFSPLNSTKTGEPGGVDALQGIVSSIIALANSFYVIVFLVLIFSSSLPLGLDNYTIKKTLPKFIAAVIMTQFAYVICGAIVDIFNALGTIVPNIIFALPVGSDIVAGGGLSNLQKGLQAGIAVPLAGGFFLAFGWILIIIFALIALVAIVVGFMYMILRYLVLFILILLAPIAFASWVLPGTEKFFSTWWKNFIRLNAMFPLITGLIAVSILISQTLLASKETNVAVKFIAMVVPLIALFLIPKTLKWTTQGMSALAGGMMGAVAGKMGAGGKAITNQAQKQAKKGMQYGQGKAFEFGKRNAAERGIGTQGFQKREKQKVMEASRAKTKDEIINLDRDALRGSAGNAASASGRNPRSTQSAGALKSHLDRLIETGDSVGLAQTMQSYHSAGVAAGLSSSEIDNNWTNALGSGYGAAKEMSPDLVEASKSSAKMNSRASSTADVTSAGGHASGKEYVHMSEGDYSTMGEDKLAAMDTEMLKSIVTSVGNGEDMNNFKFDQQSLENVLTNPNSRFKSAEARKALQTIAATKGWKYK